MRRPEKMIIYNLFPLLAGRFTQWKNHYPRISSMGFNWIFLNPVHLPGASGSLYSIRDYFSFNPLLVARRSKKPPRLQLAEAVAAAERRGIRVMTDLVVNHCAVDSPLLQKHPEWFEWERDGRVVHPFCYENGKKVVWRDLAKFDHRNSRDREGLFGFFFKVVEFLVGLGFKGFRCDAAYQVPGSFWRRLIDETKARHPDVLFLAETLGCPADQTRKTAAAGFDYIFNSSKWWDLQSPWLMEQYHLTREIAPSISFPESHDTERLCEEMGGNIQGIKQRYLFSALFSAGVMIPMGFEFGFRRRLHVVNTRPSDWEDTGIDLTSYIERVNGIKAGHTIFQEEAPTEILHAANPAVMLMWKASTTTQEEALLILNRDVHNRQHFHADSLYRFVQARAPLNDISPESPVEYIPEPFSYDLLPGEGRVFITTRDPGPED